ncbi:WS/DGAT/MGAT family O-acyltransferase [Elongatibacter sediminis]|uniref:diacylglycerol O-acyltransferase n=1 Tax=Elongatibacter sediminis TaxID=3119006 RepID=A0AAW9RCP9_9GAMM
MRRLSALDASFIYLEDDHSPMHIGGVYLMDAATAPKGFSYEMFHAHIRDRLASSRIFRERLVEPPIGLAHPCWINDPGFQLDRHLPRLSLPAPGGRRELMHVAAHVFGEVLDRRRPLWSLSFVEEVNGVDGFAPGSYAMISKVHHAAVDGGSGVELMAALLDISPVPGRVEHDDWQPEEIPGSLALVGGAWAGMGRKSKELGQVLGEVARGAARIYGARRAERIDPPPTLLSAPRTRLNRAVSSSRTFWGTDFDFERYRALRRQVPGVTVNDVVLCQCAGALRAYLAERDELPRKSLIAMTPVSVRQERDRGKMGNQVSAMLADLATDEPDPLRRLLRIRRGTTGSKVYASAMPAHRIAEFIPSETLAAAARVYTRMRLGGRHRPFFNLIITNVPGPSTPLYLAGARLGAQFGMAPIIDGLGLMVVVLTHAGRLSISLTSCYRVVPDPDHLAHLMDAALIDLERSVAAAPADSLRIDDEDLPDAERGDDAAPALQRLRRASRDLDRAIATLDRRLRE